MYLRNFVLPVAILAFMGNGYSDEANLDSGPSLQGASAQSSCDCPVRVEPKPCKKIETPKPVTPVCKKEKKVCDVEVQNLCTENPNLFFFNVDFLWWKAKGNGWIVVQDFDIISGGTFINIDNMRGDSEWNPGARVEIGFSTPLEWNIGALYTYYHNESFSKIRNTGIVAQGQTVYQIDLATSKLNIDYNILDLELTSSCFWHKNLLIKPIFGARGAWIKYTYRNKYYFYASNLEQFRNIKNQYKAGGPRMGVDAYFKVGGGFDFMGAITASLLYGHAYANYDRNFLTSPRRIDYEKYTDLKGTLQMQIGANWKYLFDKDTKAFSLHLLWENNFWIELGDVYPSQAIGFAETLFTYGLNFGFGFEF